MPGITGTMKEYKSGTLHSGSKKGPIVKKRSQAVAIGLNQERKAGHDVGARPSIKGLERGK